jgi:starch synthase
MLQAEAGLPQRDDLPLIIMIGRLDFQKGFDLAFAAMRKVLGENWQALILGSGNPAIQNDCLALQASYPDRIRAEIRYDAAFSRKMYAGGDMLLMPSRYEPCGIAQMIAMLYGCIPIAHSTGGLKDTIIDPQQDSSHYTGFLFKEATPDACAEAISRALKAYQHREDWITLQKRCMVQDFTWEKSAKKYYDLYKSL